MAAVSIKWADLAPFAEIPSAKAEAMIEDALAMAALVAPCILEDDFPHESAAKAVIRGAILRWHDAGSGVAASQTAGPFGQTWDTRQPRRGMFFPSEIEQLQKMCQTADSGGAWGYDAIGADIPQHADVCALNFGANYCSCGAVLAGAPLYEVDP